ncbi:MAG: hypothetical protein B9J98_00050 [Candidatus Terraquivivens tikiterensis]|uniref:Retroviral aspartyl protease n=1 Tax=Candidatus Terraquivivens tikiterensis TaxID=1980982 RepID=A0A2R7Y9R1_9ARCH|nr:MAG: hypothetical protein B9J98_00050 [Candidatus Terraquivivens tikiterensis]
MLVLKDVEVTIEGKTSRLRALFNSGSSFTIMGYEILGERFGEVKVRKLPETVEAFLLNGQKMIIDGYVDAEIRIEEYRIYDRIYLSKGVVKEIILKGERKPMPELIIGAPTLETWGLELDLKTGEVISRGTLIL